MVSRQQPGTLFYKCLYLGHGVCVRACACKRLALTASVAHPLFVLFSIFQPDEALKSWKRNSPDKVHKPMRHTHTHTHTHKMTCIICYMRPALGKWGYVVVAEAI
eukprot:5639184-Amphidinium_carterae.1